MEMERRLYEAALEGNVIFLLELLQKDALILDKAVTSAETPLHIAAMLGHVTFAKEILNRKSELASEFDFQRRSPLHWASAKGHVEIVKLLLSINPSVCLARDRDGRTPLHLAAIKDRVEVLNELIRVKPEACKIGDDRGETIVHLCITHNNFVTLKLLVDSVDDEFVNVKDGDGNSLLHLAVINKQLEMLKFLLQRPKIKVNTLNVYGFTALDSLSQSTRDLKDMDILKSLQQAGAVRTKDGGLRKIRTNDQISSEPFHSRGSNAKKDPKNNDDWLRKKHNSLMVVASLIATMAFQAGVNLPGGFWQDNNGHTAGSSILATTSPDINEVFLISNTVGFLASLSIILLLISGLPMKYRFFVWVLMVITWIALSSMAYTYAISIMATTGDETHNSYNIYGYAIYSWIGLMGLLLLVHKIRLAVKLLKAFGRSIRRRIRPSNSEVNVDCNNV